MTVDIYLEAFEPVDDRARVCISIDAYVCLFVHRYLNASADELRLHLVQPAKVNDRPPPDDAFYANLSAVAVECIDRATYAKRLAALCAFPVLVSDADGVVVAGLCGVCRRMVKCSGPKHAALLGFKSACLLSPAEQSVWTRFCEVDVVAAVQRILGGHDGGGDFVLPAEFARYDMHMGQPVRMHNIYKVARDDLKKAAKDVADQMNDLKLADEPKEKRPQKAAAPISSSVPMDRLEIAHTFAEGKQISLADLVLYACFDLVVNQLIPADHLAHFRAELPRLGDWLDAVRKQLLETSALPARIALVEPLSIATLRIDRSDSRSLYKNDSKRYKPRSQIFTKQADIDAALDKVRDLQLDIRSDAAVPRFSDADFVWWQTLPFDALPEGGALPADRLQRKKHQLQCLAVEVLRLAARGARVVDFCSGAGHLGIVVATLRPDCEVILLENKEESLQRARDRVQRLRLTNVRFFQCNLDYFCGAFDVGTSLHACGVATDIVLAHCVRQSAAFVCCPCCYGGCRDVPHIRYPRSRLFAERGAMTTQDCMHVAHCADQAHDLRSGPCNVTKAAQGQLCMDVMDWDRKVCAEERGYEVWLTRLQPEDCTTKNRLLIGRFVD